MTETFRMIELEIPRLRRYARYLVRDRDRADDIVQETLVRAVDKIHTWQPGTNLRAWLIVILRNTFINEVRRSNRAPTAPALPQDHPAFAVAASQESHIAFLDLQSAFERLTDEHREILLLVVVEGLKYEEAAVVLNLPIGTIRSRLSQARETLRNLLDGGQERSAGAL